MQEVVDNLNHPAANALDGSKFTNVHTGQMFRQHGFVAGEKAPVSKIVGESLPNEVMLLERTKSMLKDRILGTALDGVQ